MSATQLNAAESAFSHTGVIVADKAPDPAAALTPLEVVGTALTEPGPMLALNAPVDVS